MSKTLKTRSRTYPDIAEAAKNCRSLGGSVSSISFNVAEFIEGPLRQHYRGRMTIRLETDGALQDPAKVEINKTKSSICLIVKQKVWSDAKENIADARRILAHEVGHIWLHKDETYHFSEVSEKEHPFIPRDELVEEQAHDFADLFLLTDEAISGFESISDLADYCEMYGDVPQDVIVRRFNIVEGEKRYNFGPIYGYVICNFCGGSCVRRVLSYTSCDDCGKKTY